MAVSDGDSRWPRPFLAQVSVSASSISISSCPVDAVAATGLDALRLILRARHIRARLHDAMLEHGCKTSHADASRGCSEQAPT